MVLPTSPDDPAWATVTHGDVSAAVVALQARVDSPAPVSLGAITDVAIVAPDGGSLPAEVYNPPPTGTARLMYVSREDGNFGATPIIVDSQGAFSHLLSVEIGDTSYLGAFLYGGGPIAGGRILVADDTGLPSPLDPGTDGTVLTADSTIIGRGLRWTDPHILTSPNGTAYRLVVADDGTFSTEPA